MDILEGIRTRRSIQKYTDSPVEFDKIMAVCEAGGMAPSSGNLQPWRFVVSVDKNKIHTTVCDACLDQECLKTAQAIIIICADNGLVKREYGLRGERLYGIQNCAAAAQNMLLAAHAMGLGANWIGAFNEERIIDEFGIPKVARPQIILTLGYPAEDPGEKRMRHIDDVIRFEHYDGRYKDVHRVLGDFSVEWERQAKELKKKLKKPVGSIIEKMKDAVKKK